MEKEKKNKGLIAIVIVLILVIIGWIVYICYDKEIIRNTRKEEMAEKSKKEINKNVIGGVKRLQWDCSLSLVLLLSKKGGLHDGEMRRYFDILLESSWVYNIEVTT